MDSALSGLLLDIQVTPGDILMAQLLDADRNPVGEPEQVRTNADVARLRGHNGIPKDGVRCTPEVRRILDVNSVN
jgi:hypothetical protein